MGKRVAFWIAVILVAGVQILLFRAFIEREVAWNYVLSGDATWYVYHAYHVTESLKHGRLGELYSIAAKSPWGVLLFLEAAPLQLIFGASRFSVVLINLVHYLGAQLATYLFFRHAGGSDWAGLAAWLLFMAIGTPFTIAAFQMSDFHFDFALYCLLLCVLYLAGWSNTFAHRRLSFTTAIVAAVAVATRLVSIFPLVATFAALFLYLYAVDRRRAANLRDAGLVFIALSAIPMSVAGGAFYDHYLRFLFDADLRAALQPIYRPLLEDKVELARELARRLLIYDFGWPFLAAVLPFGLLALLGRGKELVFGEQDFRRPLAVLLAISATVFFLMQLAFPVQSKHLVRIIAAPLYIAAALFASAPITAAFTHVRGSARALSFGLLIALSALAAWVQFAFYASAGRYSERRLELLKVESSYYGGAVRHSERRQELVKVESLYGDISTIARERKLTHVAISTDRVHGQSFDLGALMSFFAYEYERHGRLLRPEPKLGARPERALELEDALRLLDRSDFALLGADSPGDSHWPFVKRTASYHADLLAHVRARFCFVSRYSIEGKIRELYVSPVQWQVTASTAAAAAQRLPRGDDQGWTAWRPSGNEWMMFEAEVPVSLEKFGLLAETPFPLRAPGDFRLEALLEDGGVRTVLEVRGAVFKPEQWLEWPVSARQPARRYRMVVTANGGDPRALSLQGVALRLARTECNGSSAKAR